MKPLDPVLQAMVDKAAGGKPMHLAPLAAVRKVAPRALATGLPRTEVARIEDLEIPAADRRLPARLYLPHEAEPRPLILFFHGGGFAICDLETHDDMARRLCVGSGAAVLSVAYRLAPEHPWPAAPDDAFAALSFAAHEAPRLGARAGRIGLFGDSAGGALALGAALRARDLGGPKVDALMLIYPVLEHYSAGRRSYSERGAGCGLLAEEMRWFWDLYLPDATNALVPAKSPGRAELGDLPPTFLATAEYDVLRDEGLGLAQRLTAAGVAVAHRHCEDMNHGFLNWAGAVQEATATMEALTIWARTALSAANTSRPI